MKIFKYLFIFFVVALVATGCEDYFGENANVDPDNPTSATVNVLLPQVEARLAYVWGGDFTRYLGVNTQHADGVGRQFAVIGKYGIVPGDVDAAWANLYSGVMNTNREMMKVAQDAGFNHYVGVGMILESFAIMMTTDAWGDVPYSDAFKFGEKGVYAPEFDEQENIYMAIFDNLAQARNLLSGDNGGNPVGGDDLIYGGDASAWITAANVIEARAHLHLSEVDGNAYSDVLEALNRGSFASSAEQFDFKFGSNANENAPWYQYVEQRDDMEVGAFYVNLLTDLNDPRLAVYGATHDIPGHPFFTPDQNLWLLSYTEQEFIRAEALLNTGDQQGAYDAYLEAIRASFAEAGLSSEYDAYVAQPTIGVGAANLDMGDIMTQKYLALYTSPEVFNDWRRTGIPNLTPVTGTMIPRRLPYPETENFSNPNTPSPSEITIFDRVWWDQ